MIVFGIGQGPCLSRSHRRRDRSRAHRRSAPVVQQSCWIAGSSAGHPLFIPFLRVPSDTPERPRSSSHGALRGMARPGLEPGTPRFSVVSASGANVDAVQRERERTVARPYVRTFPRFPRRYRTFGHRIADLCPNSTAGREQPEASARHCRQAPSRLADAPSWPAQGRPVRARGRAAVGSGHGVRAELSVSAAASRAASCAWHRLHRRRLRDCAQAARCRSGSA